MDRDEMVVEWRGGGGGRLMKRRGGIKRSRIEAPL
jgi:hypothetical protein